jgi:hypothetical protein
MELSLEMSRNDHTTGKFQHISTELLVMGQAFASFKMQLKQFPTNFPPTD